MTLKPLGSEAESPEVQALRPTTATRTWNETSQAYSCDGCRQIGVAAAEGRCPNCGAAFIQAQKTPDEHVEAHAPTIAHRPARGAESWLGWSLVAAVILIAVGVLFGFTSHNNHMRQLAAEQKARQEMSAKQAREDAEARQAAEAAGERQAFLARQAKSAEDAARINEQSRERTHVALAPPRTQVPVSQPEPVPQMPGAGDQPPQVTEDPQQAAQEQLQQTLSAQYGAGFHITFRQTASGYVGIVKFSDGDMQTFIFLNGGWTPAPPMPEKTNPAILAVHA